MRGTGNVTFREFVKGFNGGSVDSVVVAQEASAETAADAELHILAAVSSSTVSQCCGIFVGARFAPLLLLLLWLLL